MAVTKVASEVIQEKISTVVLAGGQGQRLGGLDKGLQHYQGRPLIEWVLERIQPQSDEILISANRHLDEYRRYGLPVVPDSLPGYAGPLAGISTALKRITAPLLLVVPCDSPFIPADLAERLYAVLPDSAQGIASAVTSVRSHPVFCLMRCTCEPGLALYLARGERRIRAWQAGLDWVEAEFPDETAFANFNTPGDLGGDDQGRR